MFMMFGPGACVAVSYGRPWRTSGPAGWIGKFQSLKTLAALVLAWRARLCKFAPAWRPEARAARASSPRRTPISEPPGDAGEVNLSCRAAGRRRRPLELVSGAGPGEQLISGDDSAPTEARGRRGSCFAWRAAGPAEA